MKRPHPIDDDGNRAGTLGGRVGGVAGLAGLVLRLPPTLARRRSKMSTDERISIGVEIAAAVEESTRPLRDEIRSLQRRLESALGQVAILQSKNDKLEKLKPAHAVISSKTTTKRARVLKRCAGRCFYCLTDLTLQTTTIDHFVPLARGGRNGLDNLVAACGACNNRKGARMPVNQEICRYEEVFGKAFEPVSGKHIGVKVWHKPNPPMKFTEVVRPFVR